MRLEQRVSASAVAQCCDFNSIKVRLERFLAILRTCVLPYFNSIKVRLEHILLSYGLPLERDFNSIKVRLERVDNMRDSLFLLHFNSIKVRLERIIVFLYKVGVPLFQFHKGAIRTEINGIEFSIIVISIP